MTNIQNRVAKTFQDEFNRKPNLLVRAPGRVNLLGEHVDYNDGFVLPVAIDRAVWVASSESTSVHSTLAAVDLSERVSISPESILTKTDIEGQPLPNWAKYPAGVMWALMESGYDIHPIEAVFSSDVPSGAGLSSSAALEMAFLYSFLAVERSKSHHQSDSMAFAKVALQAERKYVGVNCGIMDQFASACGVRDHALSLDCRSLDWDAVPLPKDIAIVVADTSVPHSLTDSAYNERRSACEEAARLLGVKSLRDLSVSEFQRNRNQLPHEVAMRAQHVVEEIQRTEQAVHLLKQGNIRAFGRLMNECHKSLRDLYEVSCHELDVMVEIAQSLPGCYGSRLTGAGFGGCTVNLVEQDKAEEFILELGTQYQNKVDLEAKIYICRAENGAGVV